MKYTERRCPRCGGNLFVDYDEFGPVYTCLQCGYGVPIKEEKDATKSVANPERKTEGRVEGATSAQQCDIRKGSHREAGSVCRNAQAGMSGV